MTWTTREKERSGLARVGQCGKLNLAPTITQRVRSLVSFAKDWRLCAIQPYDPPDRSLFFDQSVGFATDF